MILLAEAHGATVHCADWRDLLPLVPRCDLLCVDAPYSEKTHAGHDEGTATANRCKEPWPRTDGTKPRNDHRHQRRAVSYRFWTPDDVVEFVTAWHPVCAGWFVTITDHVLAPVWSDALEAVGRYVFAPLPYVAPGSRVRLSGDGPSAWTCWIVVARPRTREFASWGTLPGAYILPPGMAERMPVVGGKPPWLLCRLVEDYSRPGDLIVDPCCGAGTTGIGAIRTGRRAVLGDALREHADLAAQWIRHPYSPAPGSEGPEDPRQPGLFSQPGALRRRPDPEEEQP